MLDTLADRILRCRVIDGGVGTNGAPPRGEVEVIEVFSASPELGRTAVLFLPDSMAVFDDAWRAMPLPGPEKGAELVVTMHYEPPDDPLRITARFPDDDAHRARLSDALARRDARVAEAQRSTTIIVTQLDDEADIEGMLLEERRHRGMGWRKLPRRGGRPDSFFLRATGLGAVLSECAPDRYDALRLETSFITSKKIPGLLPRLENALGDGAPATVRALHAASLNESEKDIACALLCGLSDEDAGPAVEAALFARHWLTRARTALGFRMGLCFEHREPAA